MIKVESAFGGRVHRKQEDSYRKTHILKKNYLFLTSVSCED
jgi:hypothetical protein